MTQKVTLMVYPVKDLEAAKTVYGKFLGVEAYVDGPYYVGYKTDELEIGLDPNGQEIISYVEVQNVKEYMQTLLEAGATMHQDATDVGGGMLIAKVKDGNGNVLGLRQSSN
ncbi:MAG: glyoxalase [Candidatus Saccharimonadales bacterium]